MNEEPNKQPTSTTALPKLISTGDLFIKTLAIFRSRFGTFIGIFLSPILITYIISITYGAVVIAFAKELESHYFSVLIIGLALLAVGFILNVLSVIALMYAITRPVSIIESFRYAITKLLPFIWLNILNTLIVFSGSILYIIYLVWNMINFSTVNISAYQYDNLFGVLPLLFIPCVVLVVWFIFSSYIMVYEDLRGMNALLKSKAYVRGYWLPVFGRIAFLILIGLGFSLLLGALTGIGKLISSIDIASYNLIASVVSLFVAALIAPFMTIYIYVLYYDIASKKATSLSSQLKEKKNYFFITSIIGLLIILFLFYLNNLTDPYISDSNNAHGTSISTRDKTRMNDLLIISDGIELYFQDHKEYPSLLKELSPKYVSSTLSDPLTNKSYQYELLLNGKEYKVCAELESTTTPACATSESLP